MIDLCCDAGDFPVVVGQVGLVLDGVEDVGGVGVPGMGTDLGLGREVEVGPAGLLPADLGGGVTAAGSATDLRRKIGVRLC